MKRFPMSFFGSIYDLMEQDLSYHTPGSAAEQPVWNRINLYCQNDEPLWKQGPR